MCHIVVISLWITAAKSWYCLGMVTLLESWYQHCIISLCIHVGHGFLILLKPHSKIVKLVKFELSYMFGLNTKGES